VDDIAGVARELVDSLVTTATPRDREEWSAKAKARAAERFARSGGLPRTLEPAEPPFRPLASHGRLAAQPHQQQRKQHSAGHQVRARHRRLHGNRISLLVRLGKLSRATAHDGPDVCAYRRAVRPHSLARLPVSRRRLAIAGALD